MKISLSAHDPQEKLWMVYDENVGEMPNEINGQREYVSYRMPDRPWNNWNDTTLLETIIVGICVSSYDVVFVFYY